MSDESSFFRQKPQDAVPTGQSQEAVDASPSELSGGFQQQAQAPVWKSFVDNQDYQDANRGAIQAEQQQMRQAASAASSGDIFKGVNGKLIHKARGQRPVEYDAADWTDDPIAGPEARKSMWDREIRTSRQEAETNSLELANPAFHAQELKQKDREAIEAEGSMLQETDPRHVELKSKLVADDDYKARKADMAQRAWNAKVRASQLEAMDPEEWWMNRQAQPAPTPTEQRQATVQAAQSTAAQGQAADQQAAARMQEINTKLQGGVTAAESKSLLAERAEIAANRARIADINAGAAGQIEGVKAESANATPPKDFFDLGDTVSGIWDAVKGLGTSAPAAFYQLVEGMERPDQYSDSAKAAFAEADAFNKEMQAKTEANQKAGTSSSVGESFREAGGSLGFSLGSMAAAIPASIVGTKAGAAAGGAIGGGIGALGAGVGAVPGAGIGASIGGTIGGVTAGMAASGTAAYRMAGAAFLNETFNTGLQEYEAVNGVPMPENERKALYEALLPVAKNTALWEAGPEAVGNAFMMGAGKIILGSTAKKIAAEAAKAVPGLTVKRIAAIQTGKVVGSTAEREAIGAATKQVGSKFLNTKLGKLTAGLADLPVEITTEAATQVEQSADQQKGDMIARGEDASGIKADWSAGGIAEAFKEVTPQTLALMLLMGGGAASVKGVYKAGEKVLSGGDYKKDNARAGEALEAVNTGLAAIDPQATPATPDEMHAAAFIARPTDGPAEIADAVMVERELKALSEQEAQGRADNLAGIQAELDNAIASGAKAPAIKAIQTKLDAASAEAPSSSAHLTRAALQIAAGKDLTSLSPEELAAVGYESKDGKPKKDANGKDVTPTTYSPIKPAKGATAASPMITKGADGSIILTDTALDMVAAASPRARARITMKATEAIEKANVRAEAARQATLAAPAASGQAGAGVPAGSSAPVLPNTFDVPMRDGTMMRVQAKDANDALREAAAVGQIAGTPAVAVAAPPSAGASNGAPGDPATGSPAGVGGIAPSETGAPAEELAPVAKEIATAAKAQQILAEHKAGHVKALNDNIREVAKDTGMNVTDKTPLQEVIDHLEAKFPTAKIEDVPAETIKRVTSLVGKTLGGYMKNPAVKAVLVIDPKNKFKAGTHTDHIKINPRLLIEEIAIAGLSDSDAKTYIDRVLFEELHHLSQVQTFAEIYAKDKQAGPDYGVWLNNYCQSLIAEFKRVGIYKDALTVYGEDIQAREAYVQVAEINRMILQDAMTGNPTEATKAAFSSPAIREVITAAIAKLKKFVAAFRANPSAFSKELVENIARVEELLAQYDIPELTGTPNQGPANAGNRPEKPNRSGPNAGTPKAAEAASNSQPASPSGTQPGGLETPVSSAWVGKRVAFVRNGERLEGEVSYAEETWRGPLLQVKLDTPDASGTPTRAIFLDQMLDATGATITGFRDISPVESSQKSGKVTTNTDEKAKTASKRDAIYQPSPAGVGYAEADSGNRALVSVPTADILGELAKLSGTNEKLNWLHENGFLSLIEGHTHVDYEQRVMVLMRIGNANIPFYISTGLAGKKNVKAGSWYAVWGIGSSGWINKGTEADINSQYGYPILQKIARLLNEGIGSLDPDSAPNLIDEESINSAMNLGIVPASGPNDSATFWPNVQKALTRINEEAGKLAAIGKAPAQQSTPQDTAEVAEPPQDNAEPAAMTFKELQDEFFNMAAEGWRKDMPFRQEADEMLGRKVTDAEWEILDQEFSDGSEEYDKITNTAPVGPPRDWSGETFADDAPLPLGIHTVDGVRFEWKEGEINAVDPGFFPVTTSGYRSVMSGFNKDAKFTINDYRKLAKDGEKVVKEQFALEKKNILKALKSKGMGWELSGLRQKFDSKNHDAEISRWPEKLRVEMVALTKQLLDAIASKDVVVEDPTNNDALKNVAAELKNAFDAFMGKPAAPAAEAKPAKPKKAKAAQPEPVATPAVADKVNGMIQADDGKFYADTRAMQQLNSDEKRVQHEHIGFGDFETKTPHGDVAWLRMDDKNFEGMTGRVHLLAGNEASVAFLVDVLRSKGVFEPGPATPAEKAPAAAPAAVEGLAEGVPAPRGVETSKITKYGSKADRTAWDQGFRYNTAISGVEGGALAIDAYGETEEQSIEKAYRTWNAKHKARQQQAPAAAPAATFTPRQAVSTGGENGLVKESGAKGVTIILDNGTLTTVAPEDVNPPVRDAAPATTTVDPALEAALAKSRDVIAGLFAAPLIADSAALRASQLPKGFTEKLPDDRKRKLMDAAMDLVDAGVNTPEKLAAAMDKLAPDRKALPYTQAFWFAMKGAGAVGKAEPKWADIYSKLDKAAEQAQISNQEQTDDATQRPGDSRSSDGTESQGTSSKGNRGRGVSGRGNSVDAEGQTGEQDPSAGLDGSAGGSNGVGGESSTSTGNAGGRGSNAGEAQDAGEDAGSSDRTPSGDVVRKLTRPEPGTPEANFVIDDDFSMPAGGKPRIAANLKAIELLRTLEKEERNATQEEKAILSKYSGWGSFKGAFNLTNQSRWEKLETEIEASAYWQGQQIRNTAAYKELSAWREKWGALHDQLKDILEPAEFQAMSKSILNAHYTSLPIIDSLWSIVRKLGYKGGRTLETSVGGGYFVGRQPQDLAERAEWTAIELDEITSRVFGKLYPEARINGETPGESRQVRGQGFQSSNIPNNSIELVIGNFPFDKDGPNQAVAEFGMKLNLHNYFFARSLDKVKPGGLVVAITSASTMDNNLVQRELLSGRAELVGAIRLPSTAFKDSAGTEVVTDILILRKKDGTRDTEGENWINTEKVGTDTVTSKQRGEARHKWLSGIPVEWVPVDERLREVWADWRASRPKDGKKWKALGKLMDEIVGGSWQTDLEIEFTAPMEVNGYFARHPEMVIGRHALAGSMYSPGEYTVLPNGDMMEQIQKAIDTLPENIMGEDVSASIERATNMTAERGEVNGMTVLRNGKVYTVINKQLVPVRWDIDILEDAVANSRILVGNKALRAEFNEVTSEGSPEQVEAWLKKTMERVLSKDDLEKMKQKVEVELARRMKLMESWVKVRDTARELINAETGGKNSAVIDTTRERLNEAYDSHVEKYGAFGVRSRNPHKFLDDDLDTPLLDSLEDEELVETDAKGNAVYRYVKRPIFKDRQSNTTVAPETANDINDAVGISLGFMGRVSVPYMAKLLNIDTREVEIQLAETEIALVNPITGLYEMADEYLTGEVLKKLREAEKANLESGGQYSRNVELLKEALPAPRPIHALSVVMGARWVPGEVYSAFAQEVLELGSLRVNYNPDANIWRIERSNEELGMVVDPNADHTDRSFRTDYFSEEKILDSILNSRQLIARDREGKVIAVPTLEGKAKADEMGQAFVEWLKSSETTVEVDGEAVKVGEMAERNFNETVAGVIPPSFKGEWITLPGQSGEIFIKNRPHRRAVLARLLTLQYGMMAHGVGSGKTYNLIALAMELKRLGKASKVMTLVQNSTIKQFAASHMKAYPQARILVADENNFTARKRAKFLARVATGDYDSIILTHSNVSLIGHSEQAIRDYMARAMDQLRVAIEDSEEGSTEQKDIQKAMDKLQEKLDKLLAKATSRSASLLTWEQLGIDALIVDEAHAFKNTPIVTRMGRVKNMPSGQGADQAVMMQMKVSNVQQTTGGKNIFFATGTPITNTMAEAFTMLQYIAPMLLEARGIKNFDDFATAFGAMVEEPESTWKGEIENVMRFAKFINGPELINLVRTVFDVALGNENLGLRVPRVRGGKPEMVLIEPTEASEIFNDWVIDTAAAFAAIENKRKVFAENPWMSAIPIMIMQAGMAQAIDPRLINPHVPDAPDSKVNKVVDEVFKIWEEGKEKKTAQVIFSDLSNPFSTMLLRAFNGDAFEEYGTVPPEIAAIEERILAFPGPADITDAEIAEKKRLVKQLSELVGKQFSLFEDIKAKLHKKGIPLNEIAIASSDMDSKKLQAAFEKVNSGQIRVIMGSTARLGTGVNIQERLAGLHNFSPPRDFKPAMMEQRLGRIIRQGNLHRDWADQAFIETIEKLTKQTFDANTLEARYEQAVDWIAANGDERIELKARQAEMAFDIIVKNYGLKLSMDSAVYSMMNAKQGFIEQILMGENVMDEFDDPASEEAVGFAMMAAETMGNEDLKLRVSLKSQIQKIQIRRNAHNSEAYARQDGLKKAKRGLTDYEKKDPDAIRSDGPQFEGVFERRTRTVKTTRGAIAKANGTDGELSEEEKAEKAEYQKAAEVYRFGDTTIDRADANAKIMEPLDAWLTEIHTDAVQAERVQEREIFVNDVRFVVTVGYAASMENANAKVFWPKKYPGGDAIYERINLGQIHPGNGLLTALRALTAPGVTERYASSIEFSKGFYQREIDKYTKEIDSQKAFTEEAEYREKAVELAAVLRRLLFADTDPRNHRYYRTVKRVAGEKAADMMAGVDGTFEVPDLTSEQVNKLYIRMRLSRRSWLEEPVYKNAKSISEFIYATIQAKVQEAAGGRIEDDSIIDIDEIEATTAKPRIESFDLGFFTDFRQSAKVNAPRLIQLHRQRAGLEKALVNYDRLTEDKFTPAEMRLAEELAEAEKAADEALKADLPDPEYSNQLETSNAKYEELNNRVPFRGRIEDKIKKIDEEIRGLEQRRAKQSDDGTVPYGKTRMPDGSLRAGPLPAPIRADSPEWMAMDKDERLATVKRQKTTARRYVEAIKAIFSEDLGADDSLKDVPEINANPVEMIREIRHLVGITINGMQPLRAGPLPASQAWSTPQQRVSSKATSISYPDPANKSPIVFTAFKAGKISIGPINADIGGGRFDQITNWLKTRGVTNVVWDRFNRSDEFNNASKKRLQGGKADTATASNVLNVIPEKESRIATIATAFDSIKIGGTAAFSMYEAPQGGDKGKDSYQHSKKTAEYIPEIEEVFGKGNVKRIGEILVATKNSPLQAGPLPAPATDFKRFPAEWNSLNVPRAEMPQVPTSERPAFLQFLKDAGVKVTDEQMAPKAITPIQIEYFPSKVERAKGIPPERRVFVSADNYLLDGHHQWMAQRDRSTVNVTRIGLPVREAIGTMFLFPGTEKREGGTALNAGPLPQNTGVKAYRYVNRDGVGMLNREAYNIDKLNDDDASDLEEWLNYGLQQPRGVANDQVFLFTEEGDAKHAEGLRLLKKAARRGFVKQTVFVSGEPSWESGDGQIAVSSSQIKQTSPGNLRAGPLPAPDPRLVKEFGENFEADEYGMPVIPKTLPDGHPLLVQTVDKKTATIPADHPLVAGLPKDHDLARGLPADHPAFKGGFLQSGEMSRRAMRRGIVRFFMSFGTPLADDVKPIAYATGGGGGAGKSTILKILSGEGSINTVGAVPVNSDDIKALIPEWNEIVKAGDGRAAAIVHEESSKTAKDILGKLLTGDTKYNFIYDATLANTEKSIRQFGEWKAAGFDVVMIAVTIDPQEAVVRATLRAKETGRWVPTGELFKAHAGFNRGVMELMGIADTAYAYDNTPPEAHKIAEKSSETDTISIVNQEFFEKIKLREEEVPTQSNQDAGDNLRRADQQGTRSPEGGGQGGNGADQGQGSLTPPELARLMRGDRGDDTIEPTGQEEWAKRNPASAAKLRAAVDRQARAKGYTPEKVFHTTESTESTAGKTYPYAPGDLRYTGTKAEDWDEVSINERGAFYVTDDKDAADQFGWLKTRYKSLKHRTIELYAKQGNYFDSSNPDHMESVKRSVTREELKASNDFWEDFHKKNPDGGFVNKNTSPPRWGQFWKKDIVGWQVMEDHRVIAKLKEAGFDGYRSREMSPDEDNEIDFMSLGVFNPSSVKSADLVTFDKSGKPIPISERFDDSKPSILYAGPLPTAQNNDAEELARLMKGDGAREPEPTKFREDRAKYIKWYDERLERKDEFNLLNPNNRGDAATALYNEYLSRQPFAKLPEERNYRGNISDDLLTPTTNQKFWAERNPVSAAKLRKAVDSQARAKGYEVDMLLHGTPGNNKEIADDSQKNGPNEIRSYDGTAPGDFDVFDAKNTRQGMGLHFFTKDRVFAEEFTTFEDTNGRRPGGYRYIPAYLKIRKAWDSRNPEHQDIIRDLVPEDHQQHIGSEFTFRYVEQPDAIARLKSLGFDAIRLFENPGMSGDWAYDGYTHTVAVFNSSQAKDASLVTFDKSGKPIPIAERFDDSKDSILFAGPLTPADPLSYKKADQTDPLRQGSKYWITSGGTWYQSIGEHGNSAAEMEDDGISTDDAIRVVVENGKTLFFEGSPNRRQLKELKDAAQMYRFDLIDDSGRLYAGPIGTPDPEGDVFRRNVPINPALVEEAKAEREAFEKNMAGGRLAGFGSERTRAEQDAIDAVYEFTKTVQKNADTMKVAREMLARDPADIERKLLDSVTDKDFNLTPADHLAIQLLIDRKTQEAGNDPNKLAENGARMMAYRIMRGDAGRLLQIGYDRFLTPAERNLAAITDAIFSPTKKIQKVIASKPIAQRAAFIRAAAEARVKTVEAELAKAGLSIAEITRKSDKLALEKSQLMKDVLKLRKTLDQNILGMIQRGATKADIKRRYGAEAAEQAQQVLTDARADLKAKIAPMVQAGMTMEQIVAKLGALQAGPINNAASPLSPDAIAAEIERILAEGFGMPAMLAEKPALPRPKVKPAPVPVPKGSPPVPTAPTAINADWSRPIINAALDTYTFDTKDRSGIMTRVGNIRMLAGAVGKINQLDPGKNAQALAHLAEIDKILAKYGTDTNTLLAEIHAGKHIEDFRFDINDVQHVAHVARIISTMDADWIDKASEVLYANMLSGLQTMVVNATAIVPAAWEATVGRGFEMAINAALAPAGLADPLSPQWGETKYILKALGPAWTRAVSNFAASMQAQHPMFDRDVLNQQPDIERVMGGKGYRMGGSISGKKGDIIRIPSRLLMATDDFNMTLFTMADVGAYAFRFVKSQGFKPGTPQFDKEMRIQINTPGSESYILAATRYKRAIFSNPLPGERDPVTGKTVPVHGLGDIVGEWAAKLNGALTKEHDSMFIKLVQTLAKISFFPFQRVPFNILRKGIRYTPNPVSLFDIGLGIVQNSLTTGPNGETVWEWNTNNRNAELIERLGMQLQGAALLTLLVAVGAGEGDDDDLKKPFLITGSMPFTPQGRAMRDAQTRSGLGPSRFSFRNKDGTERFGFNYGRLEPLATTLAATIDTVRAVKRAHRAGKDNYDAAAEALGGLVAQAKDKSFLRGVSDLMALVTNAMAEPDLRENRKFQQYLAGRVAMVVPNIIKQPLREMDNLYRERSNDFMQEVLYQVAPIGQKSAKVDPWGEQAEKTGFAATRIFDVTDAGTDKPHPVDQMLLRWRDSGKWSKAADEADRKPWFPSPIANSTFKNPSTGQTVKMNEAQLAEFREKAGKATAAKLKALSLNYESPTALDIEKVKKAVTESRAAMKAALAHKFSRSAK